MTKKVCCGCGADMGTDSRHFPRPHGCKDLEPVTHGICDACMRRLYGELAEMVLSGEATLATGKPLR